MKIREGSRLGYLGENLQSYVSVTWGLFDDDK